METRQLALFGGITGLVVTSWIASWLWNRHRKRATLAQAALVVTDAYMDADRGLLTGKIAGRGVRAELTSRGSGSNSTAWTEVRVVLDEPTVQLELRAQSLAEEFDVKRGLAVDVVVDDPEFDAAFIIEGAPAAAVREVLADATLRQTLVRLGKLDVTQTGAYLLLAHKGWLHGDELALLVRAAGTLATNLITVAAKPPEEGKDPYRLSARPPGQAESHPDVAALDRARAMRERGVKTRTIFLSIFLALFIVAWCASIILR